MWQAGLDLAAQRHRAEHVGHRRTSRQVVLGHQLLQILKRFALNFKGLFAKINRKYGADCKLAYAKFTGWFTGLVDRCKR